MAAAASDPIAWLLLLLLAALPVMAAGAMAAAPARAPVPREVLAFYYGWWATPEHTGSWRHWADVDPVRRTIGNTARYPAAGVYDSHDAVTVNRQLGQMHAAGVTGVISSWWGRDSFDDHSFDLLMRLAPAHGLKVTPYYETVPSTATGASTAAKGDAVLADLEYLLDRHGRDPAWLKVGGRPVIFVFRRAIADLGLDGWWVVNQRLRRLTPAPILIADLDFDSPASTVATTFGGVHAYNNSASTANRTAPEIRAWAAAAFPRWTRRWQSRITTLTIMPGFGNARAVGSAISRDMTERFAGATYDALGEEAIKARPDWLLITSWNEWHEGTEIEPSVELGATALEQTRRISRQFLHLPPRRVAVGRR